MDLRVRNGMRPKEEDVTSIVVDEMLPLGPHRVRTRLFTRAAEAKSGADWEWWIKRHGSWLGLSIQAKISDKPRNPVVKIYHRAKSAKGDQLAQLLKWAAARNSNPIYFLYSYFDPIQFQGAITNCKSGIVLPNRAEAALLAVHALDVRRHYNKNRIYLRYDMQHMLPVRCVFCCGPGGSTITDRLRNLLIGGGRMIETERPPDYVRRFEDEFYSERSPAEESADGYDVQPPKRVTVILDEPS